MNLLGHDISTTGSSAGIEHTWIASGAVRLATSIDVPACPPPWPFVLVLHGFTGDRIGRSYLLVELGRLLCSAGIACLRFDQAGCGESTGDQLDYGPGSIGRDAGAVVQWARGDQRFAADRWGVLGVSMGSFGALEVAGDAQLSSRAIVLWAPIFDLLAAIERKTQDRQEIERTMKERGYVPHRGLRIGPGFFAQAAALDASSLVATTGSPLRLFHSRDDRTAPIDHSRSLIDRCSISGRECSLIEIDGESHDFHDEPSRSRVLAGTVQWMAEHVSG